MSPIYQEPDSFPCCTEPETAEFLKALCVMTQRKSALELGTFKGATTMRLLEAVPSVVTVDIEDRRHPSFKECGRGEFILADSRTFNLGHRRFDFVFFDTVHTAQHVDEEFHHVQPALENGAVLAFHDPISYPDLTNFLFFTSFPTVILHTPHNPGQRERMSGLAIGVYKRLIYPTHPVNGRPQ